MRIGLLTQEYPPTTKGGAGTFVEFLVRDLRRAHHVDVHCFGEPRPGATAHPTPAALRDADPATRALGTGVEMAAAVGDVELVNSHTWYTALAGHLVRLRGAIPHIMTMHSLESDRPWKAAQLGTGGYAVSQWSEAVALRGADAITAASEYLLARIAAHYPGIPASRLHVVRGGVDTELWRPVDGRRSVTEAGISLDRPYVLCVARLSQQKGIGHFLAAARELPREVQVVLATSAPDDARVAATLAERIEDLRAIRTGVCWINRPLGRPELVGLMSCAALFCSPSVYEPLGLLNLEAMSCAVPVVAGRVGGVPEAVIDGETGVLVDVDPGDPGAFSQGLARAMRTLLSEPAVAGRLGRAGRERAARHFSWQTTGAAMQAVYRASLGPGS